MKMPAMGFLIVFFGFNSDNCRRLKKKRSRKEGRRG
jgi:hypothetical protein